MGVVWDFFCYHCHITLNDSVVVPVHCIMVYLCRSIFVYRRFRNLNTVLFYIHRRRTALITEWVKFATGSENSLRNCSICVLHYLPSPIYPQIADLHLSNPQIPPPKKEAVEYRRASGLAPIHATIPPNYANAGHSQKPTSAKTAQPVETLLCCNIA